jgi:P-type conjugative transfer protein TrbJ
MMNRTVFSRRALMAALVGLAPLAITQRARAGILGGFATEWTQLANNLQLINTYIRQGQELQQKILMVADMAKHTAQLPFQIFGPIMGDIAGLHSIVQNGRALAYSMANLDAEFRNRFRGFGYNANAWYTQYRDWSQTSLDTTLGALKAAGLQGQQLNSEQAVLSQLRSMAQGTDGRLKAIEVANQIAEQQVQQLMKLRQLILADLQSKQAYQAAQIQKQASAEAANERLFTSGAGGSDPRRYQSGWK